MQIPGKDYNETYAPIVKSSIHFLFVLAAQQGLLAFHLIETVFLTSDLEEHILVDIPPGFIFLTEFVLPDGLTTEDLFL
jgi:hypothetical protein